MKDMRIYNYFAILLLSFGLLVSCSKGEGIEEPVTPQPDEPEISVAKLPNITFGKLGTKAMLNDVDLKEVGSKIRVYDILTDYTGTTIEGWNPATDPYINEEIIYNNKEVWDYASNSIYPWTANGKHTFFGYLTYDKKSNLNVTSLATPTLSGSTLTVPSITFIPSSTQFDFLYSDAVERNAADKNYSVVPLNLKHLFTGLSIAVESKTNVPIKLESIELQGLKNQKKATISFASETKPVFSDQASSGSFIPAIGATPVEFAINDVYDPLAKVFYDKSEGDTYIKNFFMLWPQTVDEITGSKIVVTYKMFIDGAWEEESRVSEIKFSQTWNEGDVMAWEGGKKYHFTLQFSDKIIRLTTKVLPWDYNEYDVDYSEGSIVVPNGLKFRAGTCDQSGKVITVISGKKPIGDFTIMAPVGGTWSVGMVGDTEYFTISPTSGTIDPRGAEGGKVTLTVSPIFNSTSSGKKIKLRFTVTANGREVNAQSEINRDDWTILIP